MDDWLAPARRAYEHYEPAFDAFFNGFLLLLLAYLWLMMGLLLGRATPLGLWLARSKIAQAAAVFGAFAAAWVGFFETDLWRYLPRLAIAYCGLWVLIHLQRAFGGWVSMHKRAFWSAVAWVRGDPEDSPEDLLR